MRTEHYFFKMYSTLLIIAACILMVTAPTLVHGETIKQTVISFDGPFYGTEECALDICPDRGGNFYLLTVKALYFYNASENRLELIAGNDCNLHKIVANSSMVVALAGNRDIYQLKTDHWEYLTQIPEFIEGIGSYKDYLQPAAGKITLSEDRFFFFYDDDDGTPFLCSFQLEDEIFAYTGIPFAKTFCAYDWTENALVGVIHEENQDYMAQYDLSTGALTNLFPVEYSGYITYYDIYNKQTVSGDRSGTVLTVESGDHYLLSEIPGTADLYVLSENTFAGIQYHETAWQEVSLYKYDLSSATDFIY